MRWHCGILVFAALAVVVLSDTAEAQKKQKNQPTKADVCGNGVGEARIQACTDLIRQGGKFLESYYHNRSLALEAKGDCDNALSDARKALSLHRDEYNFRQLGDVLGNCKHEIAPALLVYDEGIKAWPKSTMLYRARGRLRYANADNDGAIADFGRLVQAEPNEPENYRERADAYGELEDWDKAVADLDKYVSMKPDEAAGYWSRGLVLSKKGNSAKAMSNFDRALRLAPDSDEPYGHRAAHFRDIGDYDRALTDHAKSIAIAPTAVNYYARAKTLRLKGDLDLALADTNEGVRLEKRPFWSLQQRGIVHRYRGEYDLAIADFDRILRNFPDTAATYVERGRAYEKKGDLVLARDDFDRALKSRGAQFRTAHEDARAQLAALDAAAPLASVATVVAKRQGRRVALVIGNSDYVHAAKLSNPARDAQAVAASLRAIGFETVMVGSDLSREQLVGRLREFAREAEKADWAMVYYAGHGIEVGGVNYLIPVDARLEADRDTSFEAVSLEQVLTAVESARKIKLVVLDACRDNPFAAQMRRTNATRSMARGLSRIEPEGATLVVYAAKHGQTALDGDGANSPFATALTKRIATPDVEINKIFRLVRDDVMDATAGRQEPFTYGSLPGREDFFFVMK